jgi:hypothetical protein
VYVESKEADPRRAQTAKNDKENEKQTMCDKMADEQEANK